MKIREEIEKKILNAISKEYQKFYLDSIELCAQFMLANSSNSFSKFGGRPNLPASISWPSDENDKSFTFIAQISISELPLEIQVKFGIDYGKLYFFADLNSWELGSVIFSKLEPSKENVEFDFKLEKPKRSWFSFKRNVSQNNGLLKETFVNSKLNYSIPAYDSIQTEAFTIENNLTKVSTLVESDLIDTLFDRKHQIFGFYLGSQTSTYELGDIQFSRKLELADYLKAKEWILLFKLESERSMELMWGDGGSILFFIKQEDLHELNFENIKVIIDTT